MIGPHDVHMGPIKKHDMANNMNWTETVTVWLPSLIYKREESLSDKSGSDQLKEISSHYHDYEHHLSTLQHLFPGVSDGDID